MAYARNVLLEARADLASDTGKLIQSTARVLILLTGSVCLVGQVIVVAGQAGEFGLYMIPVMGCILLSGTLAYLLLSKSLSVAWFVWLVGLAGAGALAMGSFQQPLIAFLFALFPLSAVVTVGWKAGLLTEISILSLLEGLARMPGMPSLPADYRLVIALSGAFAGLLGWVVTRTFLTAAQWSLFYFEQAHERMEHARDQQLELTQVQEDLVHANRELARLSDRLKVMHQIAEEARRAKEEFVANVSHELRTPLNMIIGFSEMITQSPQIYGTDLPPALLSDISAIQRNSQHLSRLVDDVLDLSQIESDHMVLHREKSSIQEIVDGSLQVVRALFESKGLSLEADVPVDIPPVFCDGTRIRQVLINLLSNAGRFTEQGGVQVKVSHEGDQVLVHVIDTGSGIAPEEQEKLFEPFHQVDSSLRRSHGGSGLGLSISKRFVEMHGGRMWLESEVGVGTTIVFSLPLEISPNALAGDDQFMRWFNPYQPYEPRTRSSKAPAPVVLPRLVVLDEGGELARLFDRHLRGFEMVSFCDAENAIGELGRSPAQALVVNVPGGGGMEALEELGNLPYGTPAIACRVPGEEETAKRLGIARYLVKPIMPRVLLSVLEDLGDIETVLVVDDDPEVLQLFTRVLSSAKRGYRVLAAKSGQRALSLLRQRRPDVMLLDLMMPGMDGFQVLEEKSRDASLQDLPVVVTSSKDPKGERVVSNALTVTRGGGLSASDLARCVGAISGVLSPLSAG